MRITADRLSIVLKLEQVVNNFPNAAVDLSVSFGLAVVADPIAVIAYRHIAATNVETHASVSFPFYVYLIPGAFPALYIAISGAEDRAHKKLRDIAARIVGPTGHPGAPEKSLDNYFVVPHAMEKRSCRPPPPPPREALHLRNQSHGSA